MSDNLLRNTTSSHRSYRHYEQHVLDGIKSQFVHTPKRPYHLVPARKDDTYLRPIIIEGFFYDNSNDNQFHQPYVDLTPRDFVITHHTHHFSQRRLLRVCTVADYDAPLHYVARRLVITRMYHARTLLSCHLARHLPPVINFHNYGMMDSHLTRTVFYHAHMQSVISLRHRHMASNITD